MSEEGFKRKLAAILSADAEGYSRLMGQNEEQTIRRLTSYRTIVSDFVLQYRGRVVDTPGDNILAEYSGVVDAIKSAVQIQTELAERNAKLPMEQRMQFRIGINLGDVVEEKDRIYGDGVNIAARVESMADAGGIFISGTAFDQIKHKLPFRYKYQGRKIVKNIKEPIRVYRVLMEQETASEVKDVKNLILKHWRKAIFALGVTVFLIAVAAGFVWNAYFRLPSAERIPEERRAFKLPRGPSIAVLPFVNMSGDYEQEYFSDGLTENIITGLSGCPKLLVIARNSTFTYKGQPIIIQKVARELGVEYVVEGSVQKAKDRVRVTVQLIDAASGHHLWAEKYDRDLKDIFYLQ